ncbi:hypothetical protein J4H86_18505 [Spiractinospora alimapuensis]|uniref:hypothetical protein n=1 Tax=Spiractinospora alimapuensis TaxID=2820884 RepID=UPI001F3C679E|nr:hypothetical protein [Spiractinospora alimapuensis]QVQ50842.1 hypothetical protein J4H86_18505 [Spiractinospora alimapuensis]
MHTTQAELYQRLADARRLPPGTVRAATIRELAEEAESAELVEPLLDIRLELVYTLGVPIARKESVDEVITAFARCLTIYDQRPELFTNERLDDFWAGLGLVGIAMKDAPTFPMDRLRGILDDMETRARPDRDDLHTIELVRLQLESRAGDTVAADAALGRLRPLDPPPYVNHSATVLDMVVYLAELERDQDAVDAAEPLLSGQVPIRSGDGEVDPRGRLACLLLPLVRLGRLEEAVEIHRQSWQSNGIEPDMARNMEFCVLTGNDERGLQIMGRLIEDGLPSANYDELRMACAMALVCRRMVDLGRGEETFSLNPDPEHRETGSWTFTELHAHYVADSLRFARDVDELNGITATTEWTRARLDAQPLLDSLPLNSVALRTRRIREEESARPDESQPPSLPESAEETLAEAERAAQLYDFSRLPLLLAHLDALQPETDELFAARRDVVRCASDRDTVSRIELLQGAVETLDRLGEQRRARACRVSLASAMLGVEEHREAGRAILEDTLEFLRASDAPYDEARALLTLADYRETDGEFEAALDAVNQAEKALTRGDDAARTDVLQVLALGDRASLTVRAGDLTAGLDLVERTHERARRLGAPLVEADALFRLGQFRHQAGDMERGLDDLLQAATLAGPGTRLAATARSLRGELLLSTGQFDEAIPELVEGVAMFTALGSPMAEANRRLLADAYARTGRWLETAETAEEVVVAADRTDGEVENRLAGRWLLATAHEALGRPADALRRLDEMLEIPHAPARTGVIQTMAARILYRADADAPAAERFQLAADAYTTADLADQAIPCLIQRASASHYSGDNDTALTVLDQAREMTDSLPTESDDESRTSTELTAQRLRTAATIYANLGELEAATEYSHEAAKRFRELDANLPAAHSELMAARILSRGLGRPTDAEDAIQRALGDAPEDPRVRQDADEIRAELTSDTDSPNDSSA